MAWLSGPNNLNDLSNDPEASETIVDACHAGLFDTSPSGCIVLTDANHLVECCSPATTSLFLNMYTENARGNPVQCPGFRHGSVAQAIERTEGHLQCLAMAESMVDAQMLRALAQCPDLRGVHFKQCTGHAATASSASSGAAEGTVEPPSDQDIAAMLRSCPKLEWLHFDVSSSSCGSRGDYFGDDSFSALADGCCPNLKVLWVDSTQHTSTHLHCSLAEPDTIR